MSLFPKIVQWCFFIKWMPSPLDLVDCDEKGSLAGSEAGSSRSLPSVFAEAGRIRMSWSLLLLRSKLGSASAGSPTQWRCGPQGNQISRTIKDKSEPFRTKLLQNRPFATHFSWVSELKQPDWRKGLPCLDEWLRQRGPMLCATETKNPCCALTVKLQMDDTQAFQMDMEKGLQVLHD